MRCLRSTLPIDQGVNSASEEEGPVVATIFASISKIVAYGERVAGDMASI